MSEKEATITFDGVKIGGIDWGSIDGSSEIKSHTYTYRPGEYFREWVKSEPIPRANPEDLADGYINSGDGIEFYFMDNKPDYPHTLMGKPVIPMPSRAIGKTFYLMDNYYDVFGATNFYFDGKWGYIANFLFECLGRYINDQNKIWYLLRIEDVG